jgi:hypothetical protein
MSNTMLPANGAMTTRQELLQAFDTLLQPENFKDYGPNGLQVEGCEAVGRLVSGVTASRALIEAAIASQADAILVHHGLFWRGQDGRVTGWMKQRLALLLAHDINLFAYHLPLDAHPELAITRSWGNNWGYCRRAASVSRRWGCWVSTRRALSPVLAHWRHFWSSA